MSGDTDSKDTAGDWDAFPLLQWREPRKDLFLRTNRERDMTRCPPDSETIHRHARMLGTVPEPPPQTSQDEDDERARTREVATAGVLSCIRSSLFPEGFKQCIGALPDGALFHMANYVFTWLPPEERTSERTYSRTIRRLLDLGLRPCAALAHLVRLHVTIREKGRTDPSTKRLLRTFEREFGSDDDPIVRWLYHEGLLLFADEHPDRRFALQRLHGLLEHFQGVPDTLPEKEQYYRALLERGFLLGQQGRNDEALADYRAVADACLHAQEPALRWMGARALTNMAVRLKRLGRVEEARQTLGSWLDTCEPDSSNLDQYLYAAFLLCTYARDREEPEEVLSLRARALARVSPEDAEESKIRNRILQIDSIAVSAYLALGRVDEARRVEEACWAADDDGLDKEAARSMLQARLLVAQRAFDEGRFADTAALCEEVIERFDLGETPLSDRPDMDATPPYRFHGYTADAAVLGCRAYEALGQADRGQALLSSIPTKSQWARFPMRCTIHVEWRGILWKKLGQLDRALEQYELLWDERSHPNADVRAEVVWAMVDAAMELMRAGRHEQALSYAERVVHTFGDESHPAIRTEYAWAFHVKGRCLLAMGRRDAAADTWRTMLQKVSDRDPVGNVRAAAVAAHRSLAELLADEKGIPVAVARLEELEKRFGRDRDIHVRKEVAQIMAARAALSYEAGDRRTQAALDRRLLSDYADCANGSPDTAAALQAARKRLQGDDEPM